MTTCPGTEHPHPAAWVHWDGYCTAHALLIAGREDAAEMGDAAWMDDEERAWRTRA